MLKIGMEGTFERDVRHASRRFRTIKGKWKTTDDGIVRFSSITLLKKGLISRYLDWHKVSYNVDVLAFPAKEEITFMTSDVRFEDGVRPFNDEYFDLCWKIFPAIIESAQNRNELRSD